MATRRSTRKDPDAGGGSAGLAMPVLNGAPWYVKLVIWLLVWFGFPVAMSTVLFLVMVGQIPSPMTSTATELAHHRVETTEVLRFVQTSTRLQRQICRNTARDPAERVFCDQ